MTQLLLKLDEADPLFLTNQLTKSNLKERIQLDKQDFAYFLPFNMRSHTAQKLILKLIQIFESIKTNVEEVDHLLKVNVRWNCQVCRRKYNQPEWKVCETRKCRAPVTQ